MKSVHSKHKTYINNPYINNQLETTLLCSTVKFEPKINKILPFRGNEWVKQGKTSVPKVIMGAG